MKIRADMHFKDAYTCDEEYIVEKAVMIRPSEFSYICKHLLESNKYIEDNIDSMYCDENGKIHCLMLINDDTGDGLLINSEGSSYARYHAVIPNAKMLWDMERYPSLKDYNERIVEAADKIIQKALDKNENGSFVENTSLYDDDIQLSTLEDMLFDTGLVDDGHIDLDVIDITLKEISNEPVKRVLDQKDVDIMLAKHALWLNDAGGEQADFSNCRLEHLRLSGRNMLNVILNDTEIIGCDLENAEMCFSVCSNTKFETCIMKKITAEECDFKNTTFDNCNLERAGFMHSNFTNAKFLSTRMCYAELSNSCLENMQSKNTDLSQANMNNVSYDENEWLQEYENPEMTIGGM